MRTDTGADVVRTVCVLKHNDAYKLHTVRPEGVQAGDIICDIWGNPLRRPRRARGFAR